MSNTTNNTNPKIDNGGITVAQAKELARDMTENLTKDRHPFVGRYVICRCVNAGVHTGFLVSQKGDEAVLSASRRLWSWQAVDGVALSGVAQHGLQSGKVDTLNPMIALVGVCETIPCSDHAMKSIHNAPAS